MKITIIWYNEFFNGKGLKAKHMIFVSLFHSNAGKNVIYTCYSNEQSNDLNYDFSNAMKKSGICIKPSVLCNKRTDYWVWCLTPLSTNFSGVPGSVLLVEENGVHREDHGPATSHWQTLSHNAVSPRRDSNS